MRPEDLGPGPRDPVVDLAQLPSRSEVVVIGAGIIGAAVASRLAAAGLQVCLLDRAGPAAGTSSAGEGNVLLSDKVPGPELALAMRGVELWHQLARDATSAGEVEFEAKGGLLVAHDEDELAALCAFAASQRELGVHVELVAADALHDLEPALAEGLSGGAFYDKDCQVQPMLAVDYLVRHFRARGGRLVRGAGVVAAETDGQGNVRSVRTTAGTVTVGLCAVNAAGPWAREVAKCFGTDIPVEPRRGHVLVTEPLPPLLVRHKVCEAGYVGTVHDSSTAGACSAVVEATRSGTILLGSSREFVGFSPELDLGIVRTIAARGVALFPSLAGARLMRAYVGFRPTTPDRLPIIGPDARVGGLYHATGHEGAGIGLALVTAELVEALVRGEAPPLDLAPFAPERFLAADRPALTSRVRLETSVEVPGAEVGLSRPVAAPVERPGELAGVTLPVSTPPPRRDAVPSATSSLPRLLRFRFEGRELAAPLGTTIAGALLFNGERAWRTTRTGGQRRGLFCGIGTCFDCLVDVNGEKAVRACLAALNDGDEVQSSASVGGCNRA